VYSLSHCQTKLFTENSFYYFPLIYASVFLVVFRVFRLNVPFISLQAGPFFFQLGFFTSPIYEVQGILLVRSYNHSMSVKQRKRRVERSFRGSHRSQHGWHIRSLVANHITEFKVLLSDLLGNGEVYKTAN